MKGELLLIDNMYCEFDEFSILPSVHDFSLSIYVDDEKTLEKQLNNRKNFDMCIEALKEYRNDFGENEEEEKKIEFLENNFDNLLDNIEYISFSFENILIRDFIKNNPIILTKKIVLNEYLSINDYDKLVDLMEEYKDIIDNVYVKFANKFL